MNRSSACLAFSALIACSSSGTSPVPSDAAAPTSDSAIDAGNDAQPSVSIPDSPVGARLTWVLAALNGAPETSADVTANFDTAFLQMVSAPQILAAFAQLSAKKTWSLLSFAGEVTSSHLVAIVKNGAGQYWSVEIQTNSADSDKMDGLQFQPRGDLDPNLQSFAAIDTAVQKVAAKVNLLAATIDSGTCTPIHATNVDASLALGSAFKLWVLATLASSIDQGLHAWTDTVAIQDAYKSLPSGEFQNSPNGTLYTLRQYANNMISISDNTAADHLLFTLGRDNVETMLTTTKHHDPAANQPFLSTRELFDLKLLVSAPDQTTYIQSSTAAKRTLLANFDATLDPRTYSGPEWTLPKNIDTLEWFATPNDLCNVMVTLKSYGDKSATSAVYDILSISPGLADVTNAFSYVGYKGGSEPGVLELTWLLQRKSDQKWLFLSLDFNDTEKAIDENAATYVAGAARALLAH